MKIEVRRLREADWKAEPAQVTYDELQIDHIMPQKWRESWAVDATDGYEKEVLERKREEHIHRIGNLTLVSKGLNPSMRNAAWTRKREAINEHSNLHINKLLRQEDSWDEDHIVERGEWLAQRVSLDWPGPDSPLWKT